MQTSEKRSNLPWSAFEPRADSKAQARVKVEAPLSVTSEIRGSAGQGLQNSRFPSGLCPGPREEMNRSWHRILREQGVSGHCLLECLCGGDWGGGAGRPGRGGRALRESLKRGRKWGPAECLATPAGFPTEGREAPRPPAQSWPPGAKLRRSGTVWVGVG